MKNLKPEAVDISISCVNDLVKVVAKNAKAGYMLDCKVYEFIKRQKRVNFRLGLALAFGGYLLHQLDERIFKQECEIRELRNQLEEIKERE